MAVVSIIIPTMDRAELLLSLIDHIDGISFAEVQDIEIIIVDQSAKPNEAVQKRTCTYPLRYHHIAEQGLPNARNLGLSMATGDVCIFIDDDVEVDERFIIGHMKGYAESTIGAVAGRILETGKRKKAVGKTPATMYGINFFGRPYLNTGGDTDTHVRGFRGCNFSLRRDLIKSIGVFDTRFRPPFRFEESDYAYRIRRAGYRIHFSSEATVFHREYPAGGGRPSNPLCYQYSRFHNASIFFRKNMPALAMFPFLFASTTIAAAKSFPSFSHFRYLISGLRRGMDSARDESPAPVDRYFR